MPISYKNLRLSLLWRSPIWPNVQYKPILSCLWADLPLLDLVAWIWGWFSRYWSKGELFCVCSMLGNVFNNGQQCPVNTLSFCLLYMIHVLIPNFGRLVTDQSATSRMLLPSVFSSRERGGSTALFEFLFLFKSCQGRKGRLCHIDCWLRVYCPVRSLLSLNVLQIPPQKCMKEISPCI